MLSACRLSRALLPVVLLLSVLMAGCSNQPAKEPVFREVSGQVIYLERLLLPAASRLEITLQDVSLADAPAVVIDRIVDNTPGTPPYPFHFRVPEDKLIQGHSYSVSARILHDNKLLFITDTRYQVLAGDDDSDLMLIMTPVNHTPDASLQNTYWKLDSINDQKISVKEGQREAHLILKQGNRVQGYSGCNQFSGNFRQQKNRLNFERMAVTRRACLPDLRYESLYLGLLQGEVSWKVRGNTLYLENTSRGIRASFSAVYLN